MPKISILILTLNEELNLEECLKAVSWSDDIVVFDSFSTDRTIAIAQHWGARIIQRSFDNERAHRTASLQVQFKHPWVFNPDADEIATDELSSEMFDAVEQIGRNGAAFRMRRRDMFMGRWIRRSSLYPTWFMRLFRPERVHFERTINLNYVVDGAEYKLQSHLIHQSFNKGLDDWFSKHNKYSRAEAYESLESLKDSHLRWLDIFSQNPVKKRRAVKEASIRMPCRPVFRFLYTYFWRKGVLDGRPGFHYSCLMAFYDYMICLKMNELRFQQVQLVATVTEQKEVAAQAGPTGAPGVAQASERTAAQAH